MSPRARPSAPAAALLSFAIFALGGSSGVACSRDSFTSSGNDDASTGDEGSDGGIATRSDGGAHGGSDGSLVSTSADGIEGVACASKTCKDQSVACGPSTDGCGHPIDCGTCATAGTSCVAGACTCTAKTCADYPSNTCGDVSDGCGSSLSLGACKAPSTCGGSGTLNQCGCTKKSCEQAGAECGGSVDDGCGGQMSCGECSDPPGTCSGNHCAACIAVTDSSLGFEARCAAGSHLHAWACSCTNGNCNVPDSATGASPTCALLETTSEHAVYCCDASGTP